MPHHVSSVPVPNIDEDKQKIIHNKIKKAFELREEANELIKDCKEMIYEELGLKKK
jgi:hypothetical protein